MRERIYLASVLGGAGLLLYLGRGLLAESLVATWNLTFAGRGSPVTISLDFMSLLVTWSLTFAGTTAAGILGLALYRVQHELRASRRELARKEAELDLAREVQQGLFPREFPRNGGLEFSGTCIPAWGVSGDYYDVMRLNNGRLFFTLGDISGKGISAAMLMSNLQAVCRTLAKAAWSPAEICSQLNHHLHEVTGGEKFATFVYAEWDGAKRCLSYINAGHNPPLVLGSAESARLHATTPPLGIFPELDFEVGKIALHPQDIIVLYSDGLTEAGIHQGEDFGESRLERIVAANRAKSLDQIQQEVMREVQIWAGNQMEDDVTLLLVRATHPAEEAP